MNTDWKSPYNCFYRVSDEDGRVRIETVYLEEAQEFLKREYEQSGKIPLMELVKR